MADNRHRTRPGGAVFAVVIPPLLAILAAGCGADATPPPPPPACDEECKDEIALRALRETTKLVYNITLQGKPVGDHDLVTPCPQGGGARVLGNAVANPEQGATIVKLRYFFLECHYLFKDEEAKENYDMKVSGELTQEGVLAVQPSATTALVMRSDLIRFDGTVHDPPIEYKADCPLELGQTGNILSGKLCGRTAGTDL
jgi:hypothetical protein